MSEETIIKAPIILVDFDQNCELQQISRKRLSSEEIIQGSAHAIESAMNTIKGMATCVRKTVEELPKRPSHVEIAFGLKLDAQAGALLAKAGAEASINVKLTWEKD